MENNLLELTQLIENIDLLIENCSNQIIKQKLLEKANEYIKLLNFEIERT